MWGALKEYLNVVVALLVEIVLNTLLLIFSPLVYLYSRWGGYGNRVKRRTPLPAVPRSVFITGASSGVGEALAYEYCKRAQKAGVKDLHLFLTGRNVERLRTVCEQCRALGAAAVEPVSVDVTDAAGMREAVVKANAQKRLELVIANAGVSASNTALHDKPKQGALGYERSQYILDVNVYGALYTLWPALDCMTADGKGGQLVINASIAGYFAGPMFLSYSASKAAARFYGEGLRTAVAPLGIRVNTVLLGFVESRMTAYIKEKQGGLPFGKGAEEAAQALASRIARDEGIIEYPFWPFGLLGQVYNALPPLVREAIWNRGVGTVVTKAQAKARRRREQQQHAPAGKVEQRAVDGREDTANEAAVDLEQKYVYRTLEQWM